MSALHTANDLSKMRCIVLGAGGFIGANLCRSLLGQVGALRAFGRRNAFPIQSRDCEWITGDFADPHALASAISRSDVVFHLVNATTPAEANLDKVAELNANVANTLRLLDICRATGVQRVVFVSSGGTIYGMPTEIPTPETAPTNPITAYGISKLAIEKYLGLYEYLDGLEYRVLRVANPFGPFQRNLKNQGVIGAFLHKALAGKSIEIWGDGNVVRDYIYIDDVVDALIRAATHGGAGRIFNIGSGEGRSLNDLVSTIGRLLNIDLPIEYRSARPVDVPVSILNTSFAAKDLNWRAYTNFEDGLRNTIAWMQTDVATSI